MKLNSNGWGIRAAIIFTAMFVFCLIFSAIMLNRWGLVENDVVIENDVNLKETPEEINEEEYYEDLETSIYEAIQEYADNNPDFVDSTSVKITDKELISKGYLTPLKDINGKECSGYVKVNNYDVLNYEAFIKYEDYETTGYEYGNISDE